MIYERTDAKISSPITTFRLFILKTNIFYLPLGLYSKRSQNTTKFSKKSSVTHTAAPRVQLFVLNKLWCHLWSITEQIHGNVESICQIDLTI